MYPLSIPCWDPNPEGFEIDTRNPNVKFDDGSVAANYPAIPTLTEYKQATLSNQPLASSAPQLPKNCKSFFIVQITGKEVVFDPTGATPQPAPLSPEGPEFNLGGLAKAEISWPQSRNHRERIIVDVGTRQDIIIPPTTQVDVRLLLPTLEGAGSIPAQFLVDGEGPPFAANIHVHARAILSPFPFGRFSATYTQSVFLEPALQPTVILPIPPGARTFQLSSTEPDAGGGALPSVVFLYDRTIPASGIGVTRSGAPPTNLSFFEIPQTAKAVGVTIPAAQGAQIVTLVFRLDL